jgi:hypothetical protein
MDLNATQHPQGVPTLSTFSKHEVELIHRRLKLYEGCLRWGGDYVNRPDAMHVEIDRGRPAVAALVRTKLIKTPRGRRLLAANPTRGVS